MDIIYQFEHLYNIENDDIELEQRWSKLTLRKLAVLSFHSERVKGKHLNKLFAPSQK